MSDVLYIVTKTVRIGQDSFGMRRNAVLRNGFEFSFDEHDPQIKKYVKCGILKAMNEEVPGPTPDPPAARRTKRVSKSEEQKQ